MVKNRLVLDMMLFLSLGKKKTNEEYDLVLGLTCSFNDMLADSLKSAHKSFLFEISMKIIRMRV